MESTAFPNGYAEHPPPPDLAAHVACFWTGLHRTDARGSATRRVLPDGCVDIVLAFGAAGDPAGELVEALGVGAMTKPLVIDGPHCGLYIGVRFRPGFAFAAFGVPASELQDERIAFELLSRDGGRGVEEISKQRTTEARLAATVEMVRRRLFGSAVVPGVPRSVRAAIHRILGTSGNLRIASIASEIGITRQQLANQFATHVGVTPKMLARISRTQAALERAGAARAKSPREVDWSAIAYDLGYYDQPHFVDEFKELTGTTPGQWIRGEG